MAMLASICSEKIIKHVHTPCRFLCVSSRGGDPNATSRGEHRFPPKRARSSRWAAAGKQQQAAARSSKQQASSRQAARILAAEEMLLASICSEKFRKHVHTPHSTMKTCSWTCCTAAMLGAHCFPIAHSIYLNWQRSGDAMLSTYGRRT